MPVNPAVIAALEQAKAALEDLEVSLAVKSKERPEEAPEGEMPMKGKGMGMMGGMMDEE